MRDTALIKDTDKKTGRKAKRCVAATIFSLTMLLFVASATPVNAFFSKLATMYGCVVSWGQICDMSEPVTGTGPPPPPIRVTCTAPAVYGAPEFLAWPKGTAKYHFQSTCSSAAKPGAVMNVRWEGSWTPSETKTDRPNASEVLDITGYEAFIPDRVPGARIYMYWTARCTTDPWLVPGTCTPFGAYVPDDLREAFPDIHRQGFMKSGSILSSSLKRLYLAQYQLANPPDRLKTDLVNTTARVGSPSSTAGALTDRSRFSTRGVETGENPVADMQAEMVVATVAITFDQPLHFLSANGEDTMIAAGVYEIEPVLDLQLSLTREGEPAILVPAVQSTHQEPIAHAMALLVQGDSDNVQSVVVLTPDGRRYDAMASKSAVRSRDVNALVALPGNKIKDAMAASSGGPLPPCKQNPLPYGPRWIPVPCTMPAGMPGGFPSPPVSYVDGSNMLHACLNNNTGAFSIVRSFSNCGYGEVKVKWQLVP